MFSTCLRVCIHCYSINMNLNTEMIHTKYCCCILLCAILFCLEILLLINDFLFQNCTCNFSHLSFFHDLIMLFYYFYIERQIKDFNCSINPTYRFLCYKVITRRIGQKMETLHYIKVGFNV